jgi:ABC-type bacteriocin/lantibiotic exporter with double-glycine peptidase domain
MSVESGVLKSISEIVKEDKKNILYLLYYSAIEAILVLTIPLASVFIINSILAHSSISITVLGTIVVVIFTIITLLQIMKEYIIEKFQQKVFVYNGIKISKKAINLKDASAETKASIDKLMNYFFDITSIQKVFPVLLLDGTGLIIKVLVSLLLLLAFSPYLFSAGLVFLILFILVFGFIGKNGINLAIVRSDTKHNSIYYLQSIPYCKDNSEEILFNFDQLLNQFVDARINMFRIIIRQLALTFAMEGVIFSTFLIIGGSLVINGVLPVGEFVAAEIIVVSITGALKVFVKQIDYIYDIAEGLYKVNKLSKSLSNGEKHE